MSNAGPSAGNPPVPTRAQPPRRPGSTRVLLPTKLGLGGNSSSGTASSRSGWRPNSAASAMAASIRASGAPRQKWAVAEGEVLVRRARDVEAVRLGSVRAGVASGGGVPREHRRPTRDDGPADGDVLGGTAEREETDGAVVAQRLLDHRLPGDGAREGHLQLGAVSAQRPHGVGDEAHRRLVARDGQRQESAGQFRRVPVSYVSERRSPSPSRAAMRALASRPRGAVGVRRRGGARHGPVAAVARDAGDGWYERELCGTEALSCGCGTGPTDPPLFDRAPSPCCGNSTAQCGPHVRVPCPGGALRCSSVQRDHESRSDTV